MRAGQWVGELLGLAQEPRLCPERQHLSLTLALPPPHPPWDAGASDPGVSYQQLTLRAQATGRKQQAQWGPVGTHFGL